MTAIEALIAVLVFLFLVLAVLVRKAVPSRTETEGRLPKLFDRLAKSLDEENAKWLKGLRRETQTLNNRYFLVSVCRLLLDAADGKPIQNHLGTSAANCAKSIVKEIYWFAEVRGMPERNYELISLFVERRAMPRITVSLMDEALGVNEVLTGEEGSASQDSLSYEWLVETLRAHRVFDARRKTGVFAEFNKPAFDRNALMKRFAEVIQMLNEGGWPTTSADLDAIFEDGGLLRGRLGPVKLKMIKDDLLKACGDGTLELTEAGVRTLL